MFDTFPVIAYPKISKEDYMQEIATVTFTDADSKDDAVAIVRATKGIVGFAVSLKEDGDFEVFMSTKDCRAIVSELQRAIGFADSSEGD